MSHSEAFRISRVHACDQDQTDREDDRCHFLFSFHEDAASTVESIFPYKEATSLLMTRIRDLAASLLNWFFLPAGLLFLHAGPRRSPFDLNGPRRVVLNPDAIRRTT
jgi:hypothetical protein